MTGACNMPNILCYSRNRATSVEQIDDQTLLSTCHLDDSLKLAWVRLHVRLPELEIVQAEGSFQRSYQEDCLNIKDALEKLNGVRIGAGIKKIIRGLTGDVSTCRELPVLIEECCHSVILTFTKDALKGVPKKEAQSREYFKNMLKKYIRLYNSCAVFAPGSPLVEGIELP
jgi:hypothetical protein